MKGLDGLIRLHEWKLDEKRRKVADLERLAARLHGQINDLEDEIKAEQGISASQPAIAYSYGNYASAAIDRRNRLRKSLEEIESEMTVALEEVASAFREFKKFDLIRARNMQRENTRRLRAEQADMNEVGLTLYRRQKRK